MDFYENLETLCRHSIVSAVNSFAFHYFFSSTRSIVEDAIRSLDNQFECHMPDLPVNSTEMLSFLKSEPPIHCDDVEPWVTCGDDSSVSTY